MTKLFYDHLVAIEEITIVLDEHDLSTLEKKEILQTIDETIHHHILDTILNHLPREHHEEFLEAFTKEPHHEKHLHYLKKKTKVDIEKEIQKTADKVKKMVLRDLEAAKK